MLSEVDLPPVSRVMKPWVGTEPRRAGVNVAATGCDNTAFTGKQMSNNLTRSFVIPAARLPAAFGITETVGTLPGAPARAFVADVRRDLDACPDRNRGLGTEVTRLAHRQSKASDLTAWRLTTELDDNRSVTYLMGIVREGTAVGQVGFVPDRDVTMGTAAFVALLARAGERLPAMPPPRAELLRPWTGATVTPPAFGGRIDPWLRSACGGCSPPLAVRVDRWVARQISCTNLVPQHPVIRTCFRGRTVGALWLSCAHGSHRDRHPGGSGFPGRGAGVRPAGAGRGRSRRGPAAAGGGGVGRPASRGVAGGRGGVPGLGLLGWVR